MQEVKNRDERGYARVLLGFRVVFRPESNELVKMVRTKNRPITSEVVKIVHDDRHEQVYNLQ